MEESQTKQVNAPRCPKCGGANVRVLAWVDAETREYAAPFEDGALRESLWCGDCGERTAPGAKTLAEALLAEREKAASQDFRREGLLKWVASQFRAGERVVRLRPFGLNEAFPGHNGLEPPEGCRVHGRPQACVELKGGRYLGVKKWVVRFDEKPLYEGCRVETDITDTEYPYSGYVDKLDRDVKMSILEAAGFEVWVEWKPGQGDVVFVKLPSSTK